MSITKDNIKDFVEDFYQIDLKSKSREEDKIIAKKFYYYLCYKYSTDIITAGSLAKSLGKSQHGTVLNALEYINNSKEYSKGTYRSLQHLESCFLEKFTIPEYIKEVNDYSRNFLILKQLHLKVRKTGVNLRVDRDKYKKKYYELKQQLQNERYPKKNN